MYMTVEINPSMITLARDARGLTQQDLGEKIRLHKANISRIENGETHISSDTLAALSEALGYPPAFFKLPGDIMPSSLSYRKRQQVPVKLLSPIEAQINIIRRHVQFLSRTLQKQQPVLPLFDVDDNNTPARIATLVRRKWGTETPVIDNLIKLAEQQGIIICSFDFGTERVDCRSILTDDKYPVIFLNSTLQGDRQRFSLAYELAQLLMHTYTRVPHHRDISHEANLFAAEFLMPEKEIRKDFKQGITLPLLGELKLKWKVSMIALLYRADDLGFLTPNQKRYLVQQFNQQKIRRREPPELDIPAEKPQLMRQWLAEYMGKTKLGIIQVCDLLAISAADYLEYYG